MHYIHDIIAGDLSSAVFLASFLRRTANNFSWAGAFEVADLPKYWHVTQSDRVYAAIKSRQDIPCVFILGKN